MTWLLRGAALACAGLLSGCGTSGSNPVTFPEARFEIVSNGGNSTVEVMQLDAGGTTFTASTSTLTGRQLAFSGHLNIFLENVVPPYTGVFRRVAGSDITVTVSFTGPPGFETNSQTDTTTPARDTASVSVKLAGATPVPSPPAQNPEIRVDICAPRPGIPCSLFSSSTGQTPPPDFGFTGISFVGSVGDANFTHILGTIGNGTPPVDTPSIVFLNGATDSVEADARSPSKDQVFQVQLFIDGQLRDSETGNTDVVVKTNL